MRKCLLFAVVLSVPAAAGAQDRPITDWLVRSPLPAERGSEGVTRDYLGNAPSVLPTVGDPDWRPARADSSGVLDFNTLGTGSTDWHAAWAHVYLFTPAERSVLLVLDSDDDLVARVNGQRLWVHVVPRGVGTGRDTVFVRLAAGWNSVLAKVINRTGGFALLGRLAPVPGDPPLDDVRFQLARPDGFAAHNYPATAVLVSPVTLAERPAWRAGSLSVAGTAMLTAWGGDSVTDVRVDVAGAAEAVTAPVLASGAPSEVALSWTLDALRDHATGVRPLEVRTTWRGGRRTDALTVSPAAAARLLTARLDLPGLAEDSGRAALTDTLIIPALLDGRTIDLHTVGMGPRATCTVNGAAAHGDAGRVTLCAPCRAGDRVTLRLTPDPSRPLWMIPYARAREPGYAEYADGHRYAAALTGAAPPVAPPDAVAWLATAGTPAGDSLRARYRAAFTPVTDRLRGDTLFLVGNSHIDAAWLWRWEETIDVVRNTWRTSLKLAEIFPGYVFAGSSAAYYAAMDRHEPGLADSLAAATDAGTWAPVGGWWVEADMNLPAGESLVRQGLYGQRYFVDRFGARSRVAWTPDTFGYPWTVPQILRGTGFDAFVTQKIRWNDSTTLPHNAFFWEGRDGTRIFTYNPYGYVHDLDPAALVPERVEDEERTGIGNQIVLYGVGDHGGGPTIEMLQRAENLRRVPAFPVMRYAAPEPALEAVRTARPDSAFAVWDDELYLEYHRGTYTTHAAIKARHRRSEARLQTAEALAVLDSVPYPHTALEAAWRRVLFNQFHDILPGSGIDSIYPDAHAFYDTAWAVLDSIVEPGFARLRARMDTRGGGRTPVVVFNPLGWTRSGLVRVAGENGDTITRFVPDVPALGAKVIDPRRDDSDHDAPQHGPGWIENDFLRVEVDTVTGAIVRLYDRRSGTEALARGGRGIVLQVLDDRPQQWDAWNVMPNPETWEVRAVRRYGGTAVHGNRAELEIERTWGSSTFRQTLVLHRDLPYLEIVHDVDWRERQKLLKLAFELAAAPDSAVYEIPYGTIGRSGQPRTQAERAKFEVPGQRWADVSDGVTGVAVLTRDKYGWDWRDNVLRLSLLKAPVWPDSTADRGRHRIRVAVYPHAGDWRAARVDRLAAEYNVPLLAAREPRHDGPLDREVAPVSVPSQAVRLDWVKRAEDSGALVLRLVEWHGTGDDVRVGMACPFTRARRATLLEDPGDELPRRDDAFWILLKPYEIATVLVECE